MHGLGLSRSCDCKPATTHTSNPPLAGLSRACHLYFPSRGLCRLAEFCSILSWRHKQHCGCRRVIWGVPFPAACWQKGLWSQCKLHSWKRSRCFSCAGVQMKELRGRKGFLGVLKSRTPPKRCQKWQGGTAAEGALKEEAPLQQTAPNAWLWGRAGLCED